MVTPPLTAARPTDWSRVEAWVSRAMLPIGAVMAFVAVIAFITIVVFMFATLVQRPAAASLLLVWCAWALIVAGANLMKSIEGMSALDWRPMIPVALLSVAIVVAYPGWWM
ncbi:MAG: hypothetical protein M3R64_06615 [Pseudomonadota bacterium]|nr:hypothetical protein [Pseudomonadota bacterium]